MVSYRISEWLSERVTGPHTGTPIPTSIRGPSMGPKESRSTEIGLGPIQIERMIRNLNALVRSDLSLQAITHVQNGEDIPPPLKFSRKFAQDLNYWLHEYRKYMSHVGSG